MDYCTLAPGHPLHGPYHDEEYGFPLADDNLLFERLVLEIMQAGLTWELVLTRRPGFREVWDDFDVATVAGYGEADRERLLEDARNIRNRRKVDAIIENARRVQALQADHSSFAAWLEAQHPLAKDAWVKRMRSTFVFMGPEVVNEFLMSLGYLPGAHRPDCPVYARIAELSPPWMASDGQTQAQSEST